MLSSPPSEIAGWIEWRGHYTSEASTATHTDGIASTLGHAKRTTTQTTPGKNTLVGKWQQARQRIFNRFPGIPLAASLCHRADETGEVDKRSASGGKCATVTMMAALCAR